jgi:HK97 family phage portal protein
MSLLSRLNPFGRKSGLGNETLELLREIFGSREAKSGVSVTVKTALEVTTVLRCAQVIADGIATVPLKIMRKEASGRRAVAEDHPLHQILSTVPNEFQDTVQFRETLGFHLALCRNAYCFINRVRGEIAELIPIEPGRWRVKQEPDFRMRYWVRGTDGREEEIPEASVWHLRGAAWNGIVGMEVVHLAREAIGLSLVLEQAHARLHKNGLQASGVYSVDGNLDEAQHKKLTAWIKKYAGVDNVGTPLILDRAAKWMSTAMKGVDAEHLATRGFQIEENCRAMGVLPIMVGHSGDKAPTYASAEQMFLAHVVHGVRPNHRRIEASINRSLLTADERKAGLYAKFFDGELLRGAAKDRAEFYARALGAGGSPAWLEINEVRGFEDMDEVSWGHGQPQPPASPAAPPSDPTGG